MTTKIASTKLKGTIGRLRPHSEPCGGRRQRQLQGVLLRDAETCHLGAIDANHGTGLASKKLGN
jgi:hypothetical protein